MNDHLHNQREEVKKEIAKLDKALRVMLIDYITAVRQLSLIDDELIK